MRRPFRDRAEAGRVLAGKLADYAGRDDVIVLALPRGGVPVAFEVATALGAPLDVFLVRKLGAPGHEELAMGAIASGDVVVMNDEVVQAMHVQADEIRDAIASERRELARRESAYRDDRPPVDVVGRTVILIDDGLATGSTMRAAVTALRRQDPARIVVAVPIGASSTCAELQALADDCICAITPEPFRAVGIWYEDFAQTEDDEVGELLARAEAVTSTSAGSRGSSVPLASDPPATSESVPAHPKKSAVAGDSTLAGGRAATT
jgi:predicted phosphoribosyltransferase